MANAAENQDLQALTDSSTLPGAALAVPTPENYWPLLYVLAARHADDGLLFLSGHIDLGSISMRGARIG